jgi:hypothetical protein|tara:strand:+ start:1182 stop:1376 length:195 start_codon:yes stop_codon:yes gene_type:complete
MEMILVVILGLFMDDNKEFLEASNTNTGKWEYTGKQAPIKGMANLPMVNTETGEESVFFVRTKN